MASSSKAASSSSSSFPKLFFVYLISLCVAPLLLLVLSLKPTPFHVITSNQRLFHHLGQRAEHPTWFDLIRKEFKAGTKIKVGLVNIGAREDGSDDVVLQPLSAEAVQTVSVSLDQVNQNLTWDDFFPWSIDESGTSHPKCPDIPMPRFEDYRGLDVVVARVPCGNGTTDQMQGIRDVFRLQVNLLVAKLLVESGWLAPEVARKVYAVFIGSCGPMVEIFRCDDLMVHHGDFWIYRPELGRLKQKVLMPFGSCQLATGYAKIGDEGWRPNVLETRLWKPHNHRRNKREAYVTVLHSSEAYVCGAIVLARSIRQTRSTKDLVLLADDSISSKSIKGLRAAGWKTRRIHRIRCPFAKKGAYNEWNYSKLRVWELVEYDKIIFIDADLLVLNYIDHVFTYPELSAAANSKSLFNSGLMVIEPSKCMFEDLMLKTFKLESYNGGDQGFLNEVFTWWHRLPSSLNRLKYFYGDNHEITNKASTIHYLGLKPWMCYKDYDCNWDQVSRNPFASDSAHRKWWQVHDALPSPLKPYCGLTKEMEDMIKLSRRSARNNSSLPKEHWKIEIKDPRQNHLVKQ